jgi:hypothetical protein
MLCLWHRTEPHDRRRRHPEHVGLAELTLSGTDGPAAERDRADGSDQRTKQRTEPAGNEQPMGQRRTGGVQRSAPGSAILICHAGGQVTRLAAHRRF